MLGIGQQDGSEMGYTSTDIGLFEVVKRFFIYIYKLAHHSASVPVAQVLLP